MTKTDLDHRIERAQRLKKARILRGFPSARPAARRYGWSVDTYAQHENGTRGFPMATAERYAEAYRVPLAWLMTGAGPDPTAAEDPDQFVSILRATSVAQSIFGRLRMDLGTDDIEKLGRLFRLLVTRKLSGARPEMEELSDLADIGTSEIPDRLPPPLPRP